MPAKNLSFLYNIRHQYPDPDDPQSQIETDFDDPETIERIIFHLTQCGFHVIPIEANQEAYPALYEQRQHIDLVFNYSMGIYGESRYAQIPSMLEMLRLPYTGSGPLTQALVMNKARMQEILSANGVPVLTSQVFHSHTEPLMAGLDFPLIVKPLGQGSSAGITSKSIVNSRPELSERVENIISVFHEPALVQPFLDGREFSIPMLGNPPVTLPAIEPDFTRIPEGYARLDSLEIKWIFEEQSETHHLVCPAVLDERTRNTIESIAQKTWKALQIRDWCRIDMRCDRNGNLFVLDVNSPPGIIPPEISMTSYFPMSARAAGISYDQLLQRVIQTAIDRYPKTKLR
ncbi:MAG: D-alanine--D-alanine ligase [Pseudomonadota bacterium]